MYTPAAEGGGSVHLLLFVHNNIYDSPAQTCYIKHYTK